MQDVQELKNIVIQSFESKGILSTIRAQIRASIFKTIEEDNSERDKLDCFDWENKKALEINKNPELVVLCKLFENFLTFYDLDYSENVFKHEINDQSQNDDSMCKLKSKGNRY